MERTIDDQKIDSILCIGTPTLFEHFRQRGKKVFLLDFDDRMVLSCAIRLNLNCKKFFQSFFYPATEFARFSMLVCHFYVPESRQHLLEFFRQTARLICVCDPPFGVHVSALVRTINTLKEWFAQTHPDGYNEFYIYKKILDWKTVSTQFFSSPILLANTWPIHNCQWLIIG